MNPAKVDSLATRPTFIRQTTTESRLEKGRVPEHVTAPLRRLSLLSQDVYTPDPSIRVTDENDSYFAQPLMRNNAGGTNIPAPVKSVIQHSRDAIRAHWRELVVGSALTGLASWAVWATLMIHRIDNVPFCIFDETQKS